MSDQKRILIAPCTLNEELSCTCAADIIYDVFSSVCPPDNCSILPLSTGGTGTIDAIQRTCGGSRFTVPALCGDDRTRNIEYLLSIDNVAVIEAASIIGDKYCSLRSPGGMTSYGVGSVAVDAIRNGAEHLLFALGDTVCIDGGCGVARALGALFLTDRGKPFMPTGTTLNQICYIDRNKLLSIDAVCLCDTSDLLLGNVGTVGRYEKEIGRYPEQMPQITNNLRYLQDLIQPKKVSEEGDGAGGGIAYMLRTMFGAQLRRGSEQMMTISGILSHINDFDFVITALPHLDNRMQTESFLTTLQTYAKPNAVVAIGFDRTPDFLPERFGLRHIATLNTGAKTPPRDAAAMKAALKDIAVQLVKTLT